MATTKRKRKNTGSRTSSRRSDTLPFYTDIMGVAGGLLRGRQQAGADKISAVAEATRNLAVDFADFPRAQTYAETTAEQLDTLAEYVNDSSLEDMVGDASAVAKNHPIATLVFAVAAGFAVTRLMADHSRDNQNGQSHRRSASRASPAKRRTGSARAKKSKANGRDTSQASANAT